MTHLLLYLTLGVTAVVVLVLVAYLVGIIIALWQTKNDLARLANGLIAVRDNTQPLPDHIQTINDGLCALSSELSNVNGNLLAIVGVVVNLINKNNQE